MLVDDIKIKVSAGHGGKGAVAFTKNKMGLGPTGGNGGEGGSVYAEGISNIEALNQFRFKKDIFAEDGGDGDNQLHDGPNGKDLIIKVPAGTTFYNLKEKTEFDITKIGEQVLLAKGGRGGKGNFLFRSSRNTSPMKSQPGLPGEKFEFRLELKLIADIGFVGMPNVGKSSLLNELTNAKSKVANYQFTTLEPNLGVYYELILADIPGLIEGSSAGKGLGIKFLRHIERTKIIFHFISAESVTPKQDYKMVREELGAYKKSLAEKPEHLFITKSDMVYKEELKKKISVLKKINKNVIAVSIHDSDSLESIKNILNKIKSEKFLK